MLTLEYNAKFNWFPILLDKHLLQYVGFWKLLLFTVKSNVNFPADISVCVMGFPDRAGSKVAKSLFLSFQPINSNNLHSLLTCVIFHTTSISSCHPGMRLKELGELHQLAKRKGGTTFLRLWELLLSSSDIFLFASYIEHQIN